MPRTPSTTTDKSNAKPESEATPEDPSSLFADKVSYNGDRTVIEFRGSKFSFPTSRAQWPTRAMQAFQKRMNADGVEMLLGPQQWDHFNIVAPTMGDFWEFFPIFAFAAGFVKLDK